jgi:hypothetical protein
LTSQSHQDKVKAAAQTRRLQLKQAQLAHSEANRLANAIFAAQIRPLLDEKLVTVQQVAGLAGINRQRVHELLRLYSPKDGS